MLFNLFQGKGVGQALGGKSADKGKAGGKTKGSPPSQPDSTELKQCGRCNGWHIPKLSRNHCPNQLAHDNGTLKQNLEAKTKCTFWVKRLENGQKQECCGEGHTWEDHKAALAKWSAKPDKGKGKGKKGDDKKKGKGGEKQHEIAETST